MRGLLLYILISCLFVNLVKAQMGYQVTDTARSVLPEGAIPFHEFKNNVILEGYLNDTIRIKALLDIGAWGLAVPERLRTHDEKTKKHEPMRFSVGPWSKTMTATSLKSNSQFLNWYGDDCILLGWDFFYRRIIEISYKDKYLKEWRPRDLAALSDYDCIQFRNVGRRLLIPASVNIQGREIKGDFWLDTGLNGTVFFTYNVLTDYNISLSQMKKGRAKNLDTNRTAINLIKAEIIQLGNTQLIDRDVIFSDSEWFVFKENDLYVGLIGNQFFKNFSVIFDFRENKLYLKSVED